MHHVWLCAGLSVSVTVSVSVSVSVSPMHGCMYVCMYAYALMHLLSQTGCRPVEQTRSTSNGSTNERMHNVCVSAECVHTSTYHMLLASECVECVDRWIVRVTREAFVQN